MLTTYTAAPGSPSTSIGTAVAAANAAYNANPSSGPNEVLVSPGTYDESNIDITTPLTLISTGGAASTTIDGGQASTPLDGIIEVIGNAGSVTIGGTSGSAGQGFTFQNAPTNEYDGDINLIDLESIGAPVSVQGNVFIGLDSTNAFDTGILAENTPAGSPITVASNTFEEMWQGILFQQTVGAGSIDSNTFENLVPSTDDTGHVYEPEAVFALTLGGSAYNVSGLNINDNNFSAFNGLAITVAGGYPGYAPAQFSNTTIDGNDISSIGFTPDTYRAGILLIDYADGSSDEGAGGVVDSTIDDNTLVAQTACAAGSVGVALLGGGTYSGTGTTDLTIDNNIVENLDYGVYVAEQVTGAGYVSGVLANDNSFTGDTYGIYNPSSNVIDASYNYWGATDATSVQAQAGGGNSVIYNPWLGNGTNTATSSTQGFQPASQTPITDVVQISGNDSVLAGTTYTLTINTTNDGPTGIQGTHIGTITSALINWGDGTTTYDNSTYTPTHVYSPSSQTTYTISVMATNSNGTTFQVANTQTVTATVVSTLVVTTFTPTSSGFHVRFNDTINTSQLALYVSPTANPAPPSDVTLSLSNSSAPIYGSLKLDSDDKGFTFVATGAPLAAGSYTATLVGTSGGIIDGNSGEPLDGTGSGSTTGGNYMKTFTVAPNSGPTVSIPDFARGPGQPIIVPAATGSGLPIQISNGNNVNSVMLVLTYDPSLLTITSVNPAASLPAGTQIVTNNSVSGRLAICITAPSGSTFGSGLQTLVQLAASVPTSAPYRSKEVLNIQVVDINGSTSMGSGDQAVDDVTYLGNASGSGSYSGADVTQIQRVLVSSNTFAGFSNYPLVDPFIIGNIAAIPSQPYLNGTDVSILQHYLTSDDVIPQIPTYTGPPSSTNSGPDPKLFISQTLAGMPGDTLDVPVQLLQTNDAPIDLQTFNLVISFDPSLFSVSDIRSGGLAAGFQLTSSVDEADGLIFISGSSSQPLTLSSGALGDLVEMNFTILTSAKTTSTSINLLDNSGTSVTSLNGGGLTLVPAPTNAGNDPIDGLVAIGGSWAPSPFRPGRSPILFTELPSTKSTQDQATGTLADALAVGTTTQQGASHASLVVTTSTTTRHDLAIKSLGPDPVAGSGSASFPIPLTLGGVSDDSSQAVDGQGLGTTSTNGAAIASRRVVFRHQALTRVIAFTDPSK